MSDTTQSIAAKVEEAYARTRERLKDDPEYVRLKAAADEESAACPRNWLGRNRLALYVEVNTPWHATPTFPRC